MLQMSNYSSVLSPGYQPWNEPNSSGEYPAATVFGAGKSGKPPALVDASMFDVPEAPGELHILIGLPGSGKTTYRRTGPLSKKPLLVVSKDEMPKVGGKEKRQQELLDQYLSSGAIVVLDNTNVSLAVRADPIARAKKWGAKVIAHYMDVDTSVCLDRNIARTGDKQVPPAGFWAFKKDLQEPSYAEGFDEVHRVSSYGSGVYVLLKVEKKNDGSKYGARWVPGNDKRSSGYN